MIPIMMLPTAAIIVFFLPLKHRAGNHMEKIKKIDFGGIFLNLAATLLVLVPLSGGGATYPWGSPFFLSATIIGTVLAVAFVLYEWKIPVLPIMPLRLYRAPHVWALLLQSFLTGMAYFGCLFYLPIYFQAMLLISPTKAGALILALIISTSFASIACGLYMKRKNRYMPSILLGYALWTLGAGLNLLFTRDTKLAPVILILIVEGAGIGFTLQPTLVGMYANSRSEDRAVITGLRNFIRTIGGSFGLVVSGVILSNILRRLEGSISTPAHPISQLSSSIYTLGKAGYSDTEQELIRNTYMIALRYIFVFYLVCSGLCLFLTPWVGNTSLSAPAKPQDEEAAVKKQEKTTADEQLVAQGPEMTVDTRGGQPQSKEQA